MLLEAVWAPYWRPYLFGSLTGSIICLCYSHETDLKQSKQIELANMAKSLVIVESPAKAKTINKYLGASFVVKSSIGHVRDLPTSGSVSVTSAKAAKPKRKSATEDSQASRQQQAQRKLVARMGVDPEHQWQAHYEILPGKEKVIKELKGFASNSETIYLATDLDREGEAIAWHLREVIGGDNTRFKRVIFNEITQKAIKEAFQHPHDIDMNYVNAQQARRFLDRVVGYMVSPLLWKKIARGLSAGRVQSVAVRLIVERESEIRAFVPEEYWDIHALLTTDQKEELRALVAKHEGRAFRPSNQAATQKALDELKKASYRVIERDDKPFVSQPWPPFITSTLQQAASVRLGFSVKKTMTLAQQLYEAGYITYMRTDSTSLSKDAVENCRDYIAQQYGQNYLPEKARVFASKASAQEAHEAIRPTDVAATVPQGLDKDVARLYDLIWRQFVACQMAAALYDTTTIVLQAADYELRARGRVLRFAGWTKVLAVVKKDDEESLLPEVSVGETLTLDKLDPKQHFTKPPARYSEASLVKELEKRGIGRPSTYAAIISTIQERGYVSLKQRRFYAEKMGEIVSERLQQSFQDLMDYGFTADMEQTLDKVAQGQVNWRDALDQFYKGFKAKLDRAEGEEDKGGMRQNQPLQTSIACAQCGRPMQIRVASTGVFLGCSGYALPVKERCKQTINLVPAEEFVSSGAENDDEFETSELRAKQRCPQCEAAMDSYIVDAKRKLHVCGNYPNCRGYSVEEGEFRLKGYEGPTLPCDKCGSDMQLKSGRFGKYFACTAAGCGNTRKLLRNGEAAPPKVAPIPMPELRCQKVDDYYVLRDGASGLFLAASQFPKHRETRAPLVEELQRYKQVIDPKYHYLTLAPTTDPQGHKAIVRFSRKTKNHYVMSEVNRKATGWQAHYKSGAWVAST